MAARGTHPTAGGAGPARTSAPQFFVDTKKGEVNELKNLLKNIATEKDEGKKRDVVKKVIAYMTLGIDVSRLFSDMIMASKTTDVVQKKMIYLYLTTYAEQNQEMAILAINSLIKDCNHPNFKIRGLALRSLCSLRFSGAFEYLQPAISQALQDPEPYVKRTGIIGCIKLYKISPALVLEGDFVDRLYSLIKDTDTLVVVNSINALNEILASEGGIAISSKMVIYLLNRFKEFNEWGQATILELVSRYTPRSEQEMFDIMNIFEDRLKHASSTIVLGCVKAFLHFTEEYPGLQKQVFERVSSPMITLMGTGEVGGTYELTYTMLCHINLLIEKGAAEVFENDYKQFFCRSDEPTYIKHLKLDILVQLANERNLNEILAELREYVTDISVEISRKSIQSVGQIAVRLPQLSSGVFTMLSNFLTLNTDYVTTETLIVLKDLLRKYRHEADNIVPLIEDSLDYINDPNGRSALFWLLGEFGQMIERSPYILEGYIDNFKETFATEPNTAMHLLTACVKLFLKKPPEMQKSLGRLLANCINDPIDATLKDRAILYYELLKQGPSKTKVVVDSEKNEVYKFKEDFDTDITEKLIQEFNTLSVLYKKIQEKFILPDYIIEKGVKPKKKPTVTEEEEEEEQVVHTQDLGLAQNDQVAAVSSGIDLLDIDDNTANPTGRDAGVDSLGGIGRQDSESENRGTYSGAGLLDTLDFGSGSATTTSATMMAPQLQLLPNPVLAAEKYQEMWGMLSESASVQRVLQQMATTSQIEQMCIDKSIACIASGEQNNEMKFYFYAIKGDQTATFLVELQINTLNRNLSASIKSDGPSDAQGFKNILESALSSLF